MNAIALSAPETDQEFWQQVFLKNHLYEKANNQCLSMLDKAQELTGNSPNLDLNKQRILLLMRMNNQAKAADELKEYITLLSDYQNQRIEGEEKEWANKEIRWASQMLDTISRI